MSSEWPKVTLADAPLTIMDGDRGINYPSQDDFSSIGHCLFLNTGNVTNEGFNFSNCAFVTIEKDAALRKGKLVRDDVVLTTRGTVGNVGLFSEAVPFEHMRINSGMVILRSDQRQLSSYFLYLFVRSASFMEQVKSLQSGSAQPQLPIRDMKRIEIPIPPLHEQAAICVTLGALDDRITLLRETNATLEAIAQALFKSWFVDFDPVRAKMDGRAPEGMDDATARLFPDGFEESELGLVPNGWRIGNVSSIVSEASVRIGTKPAVVLSAVQTGHLVRSQDHFTKRVHSEDISKYKAVLPYAFAYNPSRINIGSIGMNELDELGAVSPIYVVMVPEDTAKGFFLWHHLRTNRLRSAISSMSSGTVRQSLSFRDFGSLALVIPPDSLLAAFYDMRTSLYECHAVNECRIRTLMEVRDTLLPRLISGQLRLPEVDALV